MDITAGKTTSRLQTFIREMTGERLYLAALLLYITEQSLQTTMWELPWQPLVLIRYAAVLLVAVKILFYDDHSIMDILLLGGFIITGVMIKRASNEMLPLFYLLFLYGARKVDFNKILKIWLICSVTVVGLTIIGAYGETVIDLAYKFTGYLRIANEDEKIIRHSMGIIFPTDFSAHLFGIMMVSMYLLKDRIRIWHCILALVFTYWVYHISYARNNAICMSLLCLGYMGVIICRYFRSPLDRKYVPDRGVPAPFLFAMPICALVSFAMDSRYDEEKHGGLWTLLNKWLSTRLSLGKKGLTLYPPNLFGHYIEMQGAGKTTNYDYSKYFFLDCSYLYTGLRTGMVFLFIILASSVAACYRRRRDPFFILSVMAISLFGIAEHHIDALEYMPMLLGTFAAVGETVSSLERS